MTIHGGGKTRNQNQHRRLTNEFKAALVIRLGGKCSKCGYDRHIAALDFDHLDPADKKGTVAWLISHRRWADAIEEAKKSRLLCANCHREHTHTNYGKGIIPRQLASRRRDNPLLILEALWPFDLT